MELRVVVGLGYMLNVQPLANTCTDVTTHGVLSMSSTCPFQFSFILSIRVAGAMMMDSLLPNPLNV
jgi:hypothetical protein